MGSQIGVESVGGGLRYPTPGESAREPALRADPDNSPGLIADSPYQAEGVGRACMMNGQTEERKSLTMITVQSQVERLKGESAQLARIYFNEFLDRCPERSDEWSIFEASGVLARLMYNADYEDLAKTQQKLISAVTRAFSTDEAIMKQRGHKGRFFASRGRNFDQIKQWLTEHPEFGPISSPQTIDYEVAAQVIQATEETKGVVVRSLSPKVWEVLQQNPDLQIIIRQKDAEFRGADPVRKFRSE